MDLQTLMATAAKRRHWPRVQSQVSGPGFLRLLRHYAYSFRAASLEQVPSVSLAVFRILFGLLTAYSTARFITKGWVGTLYLDPEYHLTYPGFGWVQPWPEPLMYLHLLVMAAASLAVAFGYKYKIALASFFVLFTYAELIDAALYLNHYWFVSLTALLLLFLPANCTLSIDARKSAAVHRNVIPRYFIWLLRFHVGIVYFFAGVAKINPAWLLEAKPLILWLQNKSHLPLIGDLISHNAAAFSASWLVMLFDLTIVGWLSWNKSRSYAYVLIIGFHTVTGLLFPIGVFPLVMICAATIYFSPDWPRTLQKKLKIKDHLIDSRVSFAAQRSGHHKKRTQMVAVICLPLFFAVQLFLPLRHYLHDSNVRWSEEGYYGAWRVMLSEKAGSLQFTVTDSDSGKSWTHDPSVFLTDLQLAQASIRPSLLYSTAQIIEEEALKDGYREVEVRASSYVSLNGDPNQQFINPDIDLTKYEYRNLPDNWIRPYQQGSTK